MNKDKQEKIKKLKWTEIRQLLSYAKERERIGWYYGNKAQFEKRHENIIKILTKTHDKH